MNAEKNYILIVKLNIILTAILNLCLHITNCFHLKSVIIPSTSLHRLSFSSEAYIQCTW